MAFVKRETLSVHIGQAGIQMGNNIWELFCLEHGISPDGTIEAVAGDCNWESGHSTFFAETHCEKIVPRSIFVDTEPTVIDQTRSGKFKNLFHPDQMINGKEDAGKFLLYILARNDKIQKFCEHFSGYFDRFADDIIDFDVQ